MMRVGMKEVLVRNIGSHVCYYGEGKKHIQLIHWDPFGGGRKVFSIKEYRQGRGGIRGKLRGVRYGRGGSMAPGRGA